MNTKYKILLCATKLFIEKGYTATYVTMITNMLKISTGNLTFHFPTKEHILAELIKKLNSFQHRLEESGDRTEQSLVVGYLAELAMFAAACEENANLKDLIIAAYTHPLSMELMRVNDTARAMGVFKEYCPEWTEKEFAQAQNVVSGIEYSMFRTENTQQITLEQRIVSSIDSIMKIYDVPKNDRQNIIAEVVAADYHDKGRRIFEEFGKYVEDAYIEKQEVTT